MRVLLDEMLPVGLATLLADHDVTTAKAAGYAGLANGELLRRATIEGYEVLVTADRGLPAQQNIRVGRRRPRARQPTRGDRAAGACHPGCRGRGPAR